MKGSEYFQGAVGAIFDLVFGIGGDGRRNSSAEHYDSEETPTPEIHIHGEVHQDGVAQSSDAAPAPIIVDASMANALALQEGYARDNSPLYEVRAPEYPLPPSPDATVRPPEYTFKPPSYDDLCAAAFNRAWEQSQDDGMRQSL